jgi:hypothetical protein
MSNTPTVPTVTPAAPADTTPPTEPDTDPVTWDSERSARTIKAQRLLEHTLTKENRGLREAVRALASTGQLTDAAQAAIAAGIATTTPAADATTTPIYEQTLRDVGALLGLTDEQITGPDGRETLLSAAKAAKLGDNLAAAIARANVHPGLARAVVSLADVDVTADADSIAGALDAALVDAIQRHPAIRRQSYPAAAGAPFPAGSGGSPTPLTREALGWMTPQAIDDARRAGLIPGVGPGK